MNDLKQKVLWGIIHKALQQLLGTERGDAEFAALRHFAGEPSAG